MRGDQPCRRRYDKPPAADSALEADGRPRATRVGLRLGVSEPFADLAALEAFLRARLAQPLPGNDAQFRFSPRPTRKNWRPDMQPPEARRAAALLLLYPGGD